MLATSGPRWFDRRRPENTWPSIGVSIVVTVALFASAFLAMQTVGRWADQSREAPAAPIVVRLTPPTIAPRSTRASTTVRPLTATPASPPLQPAVPALPAIAPALGPAAQAPGPVSRDTAAGARSTAPPIPLGPLPVAGGAAITASGSYGSGPNSPSGVTIGSRTLNTPAYRDSVLRSALGGVGYLARTRAPTAENLAALRQSQRTARSVYRRNTTAGSAEVHVMQGEGVDGVGAVGGGAGVSNGRLNIGSGLSLPLFSSGPSPAERRRNEALVADYRAGLHRLQDRILLRRDSIRLDSLRLDSLRLDSLRRDSLTRRRP